MCLRFFPTTKSLHQWKLAREIRSALRKLIKSLHQWKLATEIGSGLIKRGENDTGVKKPISKDLLGLMIDANENIVVGDLSNASPPTIRNEDIIEKCKTFLFAGKQTTSNMLTWTVVLLAIHQDWQQMARKQVLDVCGNDDPDRNTLSQLRIVDMIVNESLRLYPPLAALVRRTKNELNHRRVKLPQGMELLIPILAILHEQTLCGDDVSEFNPGRFRTGVVGMQNIHWHLFRLVLGRGRAYGKNSA